MVTKEDSINIVKNFELYESYLRIENLFNLMNIADNDSMNAIYFSLKNDPCELVRHEAAFCLGETASLEARDVLIDVLKSDDKSLVVIHECLMSLGTIGEKNDLDFIKTFLTDNRFEVKCSAQIAIDRILQQEDFEKDIILKKEDYISELFDYKKSNQNRRIQILFQLMLIGDEHSTRAIYRCFIEDICRVVRHEAAFCLGEIASDLSVELLKDAISCEKTPIAIHEGLFALGTSGKKEVLSFIEKYLEHEDYVISQSALIAKQRIEILKNPYRGVDYFK